VFQQTISDTQTKQAINAVKSFCCTNARNATFWGRRTRYVHDKQNTVKNLEHNAHVPSFYYN